MRSPVDGLDLSHPLLEAPAAVGAFDQPVQVAAEGGYAGPAVPLIQAGEVAAAAGMAVARERDRRLHQEVFVPPVRRPRMSADERGQLAAAAVDDSVLGRRAV